MKSRLTRKEMLPLVGMTVSAFIFITSVFNEELIICNMNVKSQYWKQKYFPSYKKNILQIQNLVHALALR